MTPITKICDTTGESFTISERETEYCREHDIPLPTTSPHERLRYLLSFRNRIHLYNTTCALSKKKILSCVPPESGRTVYDVDVWQSDDWDPFQYGRDYDFKRPFFEQFLDLLKVVPIYNLAVVRPTMENSDYTNGITAAKNCYLLFSSSYCEDCMFSKSLWSSRDVFESIFGYESELCYGCASITNCYNLRYSDHCLQCSDSFFLSNCQSCKNCYGCVNLVGKEYHFYNEPLSPVDFKQRLAQIDLGSHSVVERERAKFQKFKTDFPIKFYQGKSTENCSGNFIYNSKNCTNSYFVYTSEDVEYGVHLDNSKNCIMHAMFGNNAELIYNCCTAGDEAYNLKFCCETWMGVRDLEYCMNCGYNCGDCFGCVSLKRSKYCILNKQYSQSEYVDLRDRIKAHMRNTGEYGKYFPKHMSPFYFNRSDAIHYFGLGRSDAMSRGYAWQDREDDVPGSDNNYDVPDNISDVSDSVLSQAIKCERTGKQFKVIKQELTFYRKNRIPLPRVAPMQRLQEMSVMCSIKPLHSAPCSSCGTKVETSYDSSKTLLCEPCYQREIH